MTLLYKIMFWSLVALMVFLAGMYETYPLQTAPEQRYWVYDRAGLPCRRCGTPVKRFVQSARSSFFCPRCQKS